jgi:hypothetical protein
LGTWELRLDNTWYLGGSPLASGLVHQSSEGSSSFTVLTLGASLGYFFTPVFEGGAGLSYLYFGEFLQVVGASAFARVYSMLLPRVGVYLGAGALFQVEIPSRASNFNVYGLGPDAGLEPFVTDTWAVRLGVTYRHVWASGETTTTTDVFGLNFGIAAYF